MSVVAVMRAGFRHAGSRTLSSVQGRSAYRRLMRRLVGCRITLREMDAAEYARVVGAVSGRQVPVRPIPTNHSCWGAYVAGRPAGCVDLFRNPPDAEQLPGWWYGGLFVRPRYRGLGIAERLVSAAVECARAGGAGELRAWTAPRNARMQRLAGKLGFVVSDEPALAAQCRAFTGSRQVILRIDLVPAGSPAPSSAAL